MQIQHAEKRRGRKLPTAGCGHRIQRAAPRFPAEKGLGKVIDHLDIDDLAVDDGHLFILPAICRVVIHSRFVTPVVAVAGIDRIRLIVINQIHWHSDDNIPPANIVIPSRTEAGGPAQTDKMVAVPIGAPEVAPPPGTAVVEPAAMSWVKVVRREVAVFCPLPAAHLVQSLAHQAPRGRRSQRMVDGNGRAISKRLVSDILRVSFVCPRAI